MSRTRESILWHLSPPALLVLCALVTWPGCLVPGSITERKVQNAQIQVDRAKLVPSAEGLVRRRRRAASDPGGTIRFTVPAGAVSDPDNDAPHFCWYIDYDPRAPSIEFSFDPTFEIQPCGGDPRFQNKDRFAVTLIISDRPLDITVPDFRTFGTGRGQAGGGIPATTQEVDWDLELDGGCP